MSAMIFVTLIRTGKTPAHVQVAKGSTVEDILVAAGVSPTDYEGWTITSEDGNVLGLADTINATTSLVAGKKVDGATA